MDANAVGDDKRRLRRRWIAGIKSMSWILKEPDEFTGVILHLHNLMNL